jgi:hypothetical protein
MISASTTANMRIGLRDSLWLALAVLLHAVLLLVPLKHLPSAGEVSRVISVSLPAPRKPEPVIETIEPVPPTPVETLPLREETGPPRITAADPVPAEPEPVEPGINSTTARLLDFAGRFKWPSTEQERHRELGVFVPQGVPDNWRPGVVVEDNLFNGMVLPVKTEIVDRWLAADGSHRVVINTPLGQTLCGRAPPYDPMNTLIEPIMSWWECGGGGERSFRMPDRFMRANRYGVEASAGGLR